MLHRQTARTKGSAGSLRGRIEGLATKAMLRPQEGQSMGPGGEPREGA